MKYLLLFAFAFTAQAATIDHPVLYSQAEKAKSCLETLLLTHTEDPGNIFVKWDGPGVRADMNGSVDPSTALYIFQMMPSDKWYAIAFYSNSDSGWQLFTYNPSGQLKIGYHALTMESTGYLFRINPRAISLLDDDTIPYQEIDLSPCEASFKK